MKKKIRIISAIAVLTMFVLAACGKGDDAADPNLGVYKAKKAEMSGFEIGIEDMFGSGFTFELSKKGKGRVEIDGEGGKVKWTLEGDKFHAEGGGAEFDGTLKDGVMVLEDLQGAGITLTLVCDEAVAASKSSGDGYDAGNAENAGENKDDGAGKTTNEKLGLLLESPGEDAGKYVLSTVTQNGNVYMKEDLEKKGIDAWIEMNADGTGKINLVGTLMDMTWSDGNIHVDDNGEGVSEDYRYSFANEFLVLVDGDMTLAFTKEGGASSSSGADDDFKLYEAGTPITEELMKRYEGDWHGLLMYSNAQGDKWKDRDGKKCDVIARICLDENGNVTPFFAAAMKDDPEKYNFRNVTAELDPEFDGMYMSGDFLDGGSFDTEYVDEKDGFIYIALKVQDDSGDSIDVTIGMKRRDAKWTDDDYPRYPDEGVEFFKGQTLEQVLSSFGNPPKGMPGQTHVTDWED